jgi:hypothetical protein
VKGNNLAFGLYYRHTGGLYLTLVVIGSGFAGRIKCVPQVPRWRLTVVNPALAFAAVTRKTGRRCGE